MMSSRLPAADGGLSESCWPAADVRAMNGFDDSQVAAQTCATRDGAAT